MGDVIAEELGVSADPEIIHRKLHSGDRYIIIASDGVFEFLTNQVSGESHCYEATIMMLL
jgi:serine/threonine protein phosphatase PrpC